MSSVHRSGMLKRSHILIEQERLKGNLSIDKIYLLPQWSVMRVKLEEAVGKGWFFWSHGFRGEIFLANRTHSWLSLGRSHKETSSLTFAYLIWSSKSYLAGIWTINWIIDVVLMIKMNRHAKLDVIICPTGNHLVHAWPLFSSHIHCTQYGRPVIMASYCLGP